VKYIRKAGCPHPYSQWCRDVAGTNKSDWREVPSVQKRGLLAALIREQGELCAYTMRRIHDDSSHVEHIKPQTLCRADRRGSDLDYMNLVACFPRDGMQATYRYGAQSKDSWWDNDGVEFISPLQPVCERLFRFDLNGEITAVGDRASAARKTISVLALDHRSLTEDRKRVIEEFIYGPRGDDPMSPANARRARDTICDPNTHGGFYEFCVAIRHALERHLTVVKKLAQRRRAVRRGR
jgi:uncharacterized protein (TIGR02646 family)